MASLFSEMKGHTPPDFNVKPMEMMHFVFYNRTGCDRTKKMKKKLIGRLQLLLVCIVYRARSVGYMPNFIPNHAKLIMISTNSEGICPGITSSSCVKDYFQYETKSAVVDCLLFHIHRPKFNMTASA